MLGSMEPKHRSGVYARHKEEDRMGAAAEKLELTETAARVYDTLRPHMPRDKAEEFARGISEAVAQVPKGDVERLRKENLKAAAGVSTSKALTISLSEDDVEEAKRAAARLGLRVSTWVRMLIRKEISR